MAWSDFTSGVLDQGLSTFGQAVTYTPTVGAPVDIVGVFDKAHTEVTLGHAAPVSSTHPTLGIKLSVLALRPVRGDAVLIASISYRVIDCEDDGQGGASLRLQRT